MKTPRKYDPNLIGYARVSTREQNLDLQREALIRAGVDPQNIFEEHVSGAAAKRPMRDAAMRQCRPGSTLVVWKLDRVSRSLIDLPMGTRRSQHNRGRKPFYKDHGATAKHILSHKRYGAGYYLDRGTWWRGEDVFALDVLCEADADIEGAADALGRPPKSVAWKARDLGLTLPREWARLLLPKGKSRSGPRALLNYPYIQKLRPEHADIVAINNLIPKSVPDHMRSDMCQEIMLAILEGRTTLQRLQERSRSPQYFIKKFYKDNFEQGGFAISFNTAGNDEDDEIAARSIARKEWHYGEMVERHRHLDSFNAITPATQLEATWNDQVGRVRFDLNRAGMFLSHDEVEMMMSSDDYDGVDHLLTSQQ